MPGTGRLTVVSRQSSVLGREPSVDSARSSSDGRRSIVVEVTENADSLAKEFGERAWATTVNRGAQGSIEITVTDLGAAQHDIPAMVAARGSGLARLEAGEISLEEVFVELVGGER